MIINIGGYRLNIHINIFYNNVHICKILSLCEFMSEAGAWCYAQCGLVCTSGYIWMQVKITKFENSK